MTPADLAPVPVLLRILQCGVPKWQPRDNLWGLLAAQCQGRHPLQHWHPQALGPRSRAAGIL
jgi:hypothetical protein